MTGCSLQLSKVLNYFQLFDAMAMNFIWKNKDSLAVTTVLATFLANPELYITGAKELIVDPIVTPIVKHMNGTLIIGSILVVAFLPFIVRSLVKAKEVINPPNEDT